MVDGGEACVLWGVRLFISTSLSENNMARASMLIPLVLLSSLASPPTLSGQDIRVALSVSEKTGGIFESNFRAALSAIPDVEVVYPGEATDYLLRVVVICDTGSSNCSMARRYSLAITVSTPVDERFLVVLAERFASDTLSSFLQSTLRNLTRMLERHQMTLGCLLGTRKLREGNQGICCTT